MTSLLAQFGVDEDDFEWVQLGSCYNINTKHDKEHLNLFFDDYEDDAIIAIQVDEMCLGCPVAAMCYDYGVETKSHGVWGGIYLRDGNIDKPKNAHKTADVWKRVKAIHGIRSDRI
jgi:hypothetical protein